MKLFIITGTSSGIGNSLANLALSLGHHVLGISRTVTIFHEFYKHMTIDFSSFKDVKTIVLPKLVDDYDSIYLVNNAGTVGNIAPLVKKSSQDIFDEYQINIVSPTILSGMFIEAYKLYINKDLKIVNISSGAANSNFDGWSTYNASKSALNQLTITLQNEMDIYKHPIKCYAIAPGVVNTKMQEYIREVSPSDFSKGSYFNDLYSNNYLIDSSVCSMYLMAILIGEITPESTVFSLKGYYE